MPYAYTISQLVNTTIDEYLTKNKKGANAKDPEVVCLNQLKEVFANCRTRESLIQAIAILEKIPLLSAYTNDPMIMRDTKVSNRLPASELTAQLKAQEYWQTNKIAPVKLKKLSSAFEDTLRSIHAQTTKILNGARIVPMTQQTLDHIMNIKKTSINFEVPAQGLLHQFLQDLISPSIYIENKEFYSRQGEHNEKLQALKELADGNELLMNSLVQINQHIGAGVYSEFAASSVDLPKTMTVINNNMGKLVEAEINQSHMFQFEDSKSNNVDNIIDIQMLHGKISFRLFKDSKNQVYLQINSTSSGYTLLSEYRPPVQAYYDLASHRAMPHYGESSEAIKPYKDNAYPTLEHSALMRFEYDPIDNMYKPCLISGYTIVNDQNIRLNPFPENKSLKTNDYQMLDQYQDHEIENRINSIMEGIYFTKRPKYGYLVQADGLRPYFNKLNNRVMINNMPLSAQNEMDKLITITKFSKSSFSDMSQKEVTYADFILFHGSDLTTAVLREFETNIEVPNIKGIAVDDFKTITLNYYRDSQDKLMAQVVMNVYGFRDLETNKVSVLDASTNKLQTFEPNTVAQAWKNNLDDYGQPKNAFKPIGNFVLDVEISKDGNYIYPKVVNAVCGINTVDASFKGERLSPQQAITEEVSNVNNSTPQLRVGGPSS